MIPVGNCPSCHGFRTIGLEKNTVACAQCDWAFEVLCPYCSVGRLQPQGSDHQCTHCSRGVLAKTLAYIIANKVFINRDTRCVFCGGPTVEKPEANITPRCFDHPVCGNQGGLFDSGIRQPKRVFLDFETTGLEVGTHSIIEIGACKVDEDGAESFFQELVKPAQPIHSHITKITGITNDMVQHAPALRDVLTQFLVFSEGASLVAHNAQFDIPWLVTSLVRFDIHVPFRELVCTLKWAKTIEIGKRSLGALSKKYNIGHENAHRALADAVVTKELFAIYERDCSTVPTESMERYMELSQKIVQQNPSFIQN
jgi:DNA polymerase III epsilon subunit family exonuclease